MKRPDSLSSRPFIVRVRPRSLRTRLLGSISILIGAIAVFVFLVFPEAIERQAMRGIEAQAQSIGAMAANSVASAVWFEDETNMADALRGALVNPGVVYVDVSDGEGTVWASVGHDPDPDQSLEQATETFATSTPVVFSGERIRASRKPSEPHGKGGRGKFIRFAGNPSDHRQLIAPPKEQGK